VSGRPRRMKLGGGGAAALIATAMIIWRDRASGPAWHTVTAGLLFAVMIAWSGHDNVLIGLVLVAVTLVQAIVAHRQPPPAGPVLPSQAGKLKVSQRSEWAGIGPVARWCPGWAAGLLPEEWDEFLGAVAVGGVAGQFPPQ
jgi:hypothetical protein